MHLLPCVHNSEAYLDETSGVANLALRLKHDIVTSQVSYIPHFNQHLLLSPKSATSIGPNAAHLPLDLTQRFPYCLSAPPPPSFSDSRSRRAIIPPGYCYLPIPQGSSRTPFRTSAGAHSSQGLPTNGRLYCLRQRLLDVLACGSLSSSNDRTSGGRCGGSCRRRRLGGGIWGGVGVEHVAWGRCQHRGSDRTCGCVVLREARQVGRGFKFYTEMLIRGFRGGRGVAEERGNINSWLQGFQLGS